MAQASVRSPDVLVVCTANVARSPLFEARLRFEAQRRLGTGGLTIASAGTDARFGEGPAPGSQRVAASWGLSLDDHVATPVMHHPMDRVALVLVMTRGHARALTAHHPDVFSRCFTVPEFVRCIEQLESRGSIPTPPPRLDADGLRTHIDQVVGLADRHRPPRRRRALDVADPIGSRQPVYDQLGEGFVDAAATIADALFGRVATSALEA